MSSPGPRPIVNKPADSAPWKAEACCDACPAVAESPIDDYYSVATDLVLRASKKDADELIRRLLLLELVSAVELYFRRIISELTVLCPCARETASELTLTLGAARYYPADAVARALLENGSLASEQEIRRAVGKVVGLEVKPTSSEGVALAAFDRVCQLRHAAVHARGQLGAANISILAASVRPAARMKVALDALAFQSVVSQAHNTVRAMNQFFFDCTIDRWWKKKLQCGRWEDDQALFEPLARLCVSVQDGGALDIAKLHGDVVARQLGVPAGGAA